jgi:ribosome maturation factor RimP
VDTLINEIREKAEGMLPDKSFFVVSVSLTGSKGRRRLELLADGDHGIDIDVCSKLSRELSDWLDNNNLIDGPYILEVGSPGTDYPIVSLRQYKKNIGRLLKVEKNDNTEIKGKLFEVDETGITVEIQSNNKKAESVKELIGFNQIRKSTVIVSFK